MRLGGLLRAAMGRRTLMALVGAAVLVPITSCAGPTADASECTGALIVSLETLETKLTEPGELRHGRMVERAPDEFFVSAELLPADEEEDHDGDILTWFTTDPAGDEFFAVDVKARDHSMWPDAPFGVKEDGAITSRGCVLPHRGEPPDEDCQPGFEAFC